MKSKIFGLFFLIGMLPLTSLRAQQDSTTLHFSYADREQTLINRLNDIQYLKLTCTDTLMRGKRFLLLIEEYRNGQKIMADSTNLKCEEEVMEIKSGEKTFLYHLNTCDKMKFDDDADSFSLSLAGKLTGSDFTLLADYPGIQSQHELKGTDTYSLRTLFCDADERMRVPVGILSPILAYTPPFRLEQGGASYCVLGTQSHRDWHNRFGVEHYYIFSLLIE